nr:uncharacterized protein C9orf85 homolog [Lytechinus pictus]
MSSQRGNVKKSKPPKHVNKTGFKNSMHDTSKRTKEINHLIISGVCLRCKEILEWKIKYKKYKPLTQPKKCTKCQQKRVKDAYHIICTVCREAENVCGKCGLQVDQEESDSNRLDSKEEAIEELACLSERERRAYLRAQEKTSGSQEQSRLPRHQALEEVGESHIDNIESSVETIANRCSNVHLNGIPTS